MKQRISVLLSVMLGLTAAMTGLVPGTADTAKAAELKKGSYIEGEALAMIKKEVPGAKAKAASVLDLDKGLQIEDLWTFQQGDTAKKQPAAGAKSANAGAAGDFSIALIKSDTLDTEALIKTLEENESIKFAEPNYKIKANSALTNDTYSDSQWGLKNTGQNGGTPGKDIAPKALWDQLSDGAKNKPVVAVVDSGIDYTHEDLADHMWENPYQGQLPGEHGFDFINGDTDPMDDNGHGTHCAGIIAAQSDNQKGISGVAPSANLMALKILNKEGMSSSAYHIAAYDYISKAMDLGVPIAAINNSWGIAGWAGSRIEREIIDLVGKKGAVTVTAAGNEGLESGGMDYPAGVKSPYLINVAAVNEDNQLASYSNFSEEFADLAAPGSDILSTVPYNCYNPAIYGDRAEQLSSAFTDYEEENLQEIKWGVPEIIGDEDCTIGLDTEEYFGATPGKSLKIESKGMKKGEQVLMKIPYTVKEINDRNNLPQVSAMVKTQMTGKSDGEPSFLFFMEGANREIDGFDTDNWNGEWTGMYAQNGNTPWSQMQLASGAQVGKKSQERAIFLCLSAEEEGDMTVYLDKLGVSRENAEPETFGKYGYMSGTSMAAPFVSGAAALLYQTDSAMAPEDRVNTLLSMTEKEPSLEGKVASGGVLKLSKKPFVAPRIYGASVSAADKTITIGGNGFTKDSVVKVNEKKAKIISSSAKKIVIKDEGWINRQANLTVTGSNGTAQKKSVYLVKGKKAFALIQRSELGDEDYRFDPDSDEDEDWEEDTLVGGLATDGKTFYSIDDTAEELKKYTENKSWKGLTSFIELDVIKMFGKDYTDESEDIYRKFVSGNDLVYLDGKLYNIASMVKMMDAELDWEDLFNEEYWDMAEDPSSGGYSREYRLISMDPKTEKASSLGKIPKGLANTTGWTMASYNGKLYVMGGYDFSKKELSRQVTVYDPKTKKWSSGPSLPEGRALGKALQSANSMVYTLGMGSGGECPKNLIFTDGKWKVSKADLAPYSVNEIKLSGENRTYYDGSIGLKEGSIFYMGTPADGLGDTFTYSIAKDKYTASSTQMIGNSPANFFEGITVGGKVYGFDEESNLYKGTVYSGLVKVSSPKKTGGYISGSGKSYMPGSLVTLKAVPYKGYYVKSFTAAGKKISGNTAVLRPTADVSASAVFGKYVMKIKLNKTKVSLRAGKTVQLKASVSPSSASNKQVTYRSGNSKYASVTSKGLVTAKKAGIGKTVTIQAKAKDGSGKSASCKVRIY